MVPWLFMVVPRGSIAVLLAVALCGCSIITVRGAPDHPTPSPPDCTTSKAAVYVDGVLGGGAVATSLFVGLGALADSNNREQLGYAALFTFLSAIPLAISGIIGGARVESCRDAHDQYRMRQAPPFYAPPAPF